MGLPRSSYVRDGEEGVFHCFSRCVRRAFLYGFDTSTGRDFSHRKTLLVDRLRHLATIFAIEVCAYAIMDNHYHTVLRTRPDIVALWSDRQVATRWLTLFPRKRSLTGEAIPPGEEQIRTLTDCPERIEKLRVRLSSLSWFMGRLNEFIARAANKEDDAKGRFWESRFKCQKLLDEAAIAACMVYVDLNPIRAGRAATPEASEFTSIRERIRAWQKETMTPVPGEEPKDGQPRPARDLQMLENASQIDGSESNSANWLCPIQSDSQRRGILQMTAAEYIDLVDMSGRMTRSGKRGAIDANLVPILLRIGANPQAWSETVSRFGTRFCLAAGLVSSLRGFAEQLGRHWLKGLTTARTAFAS